MVSEECISAFKRMNSSKSQSNCCAFSYDEHEHLQINSDLSPSNEAISWDEMINKLRSDQCAYIFYQFKYISETDQIERSKLISILWSPHHAHRKEKMMSAFFSQSVHDKLSASSAVFCHIQAADISSLEYFFCERENSSPPHC